MGACGCIGGNIGARIAGPDGSWYVLELYPGCEYCMELPGVILGRYDPDHPMWDEIMELPVVDPGIMYLLPLMDYDDAVKQARERYDADSGEAVFVEEELIPFLSTCVHKMGTKWRTHLRRDK